MDADWDILFNSVVRLLDFLYVGCEIKSTEIGDDEEIPSFLKRRGYEEVEDQF